MSEQPEEFPKAMGDSLSIQSCLEHKTITICAHKGTGGLVCQMDMQTAMKFMEELSDEYQKVLDRCIAESATINGGDAA